MMRGGLGDFHQELPDVETGGRKRLALLLERARAIGVDRLFDKVMEQVAKGDAHITIRNEPDGKPVPENE